MSNVATQFKIVKPIQKENKLIRSICLVSDVFLVAGHVEALYIIVDREPGD